jgi:hypothetical protein
MEYNLQDPESRMFEVSIIAILFDPQLTPNLLDVQRP